MVAEALARALCDQRRRFINILASAWAGGGDNCRASGVRISTEAAPPRSLWTTFKAIDAL